MPTLAPKQRKLLGLNVPEPLSNIADAVEESQRILDLPDNWDEEGSLAYSPATWKKAASFLLRNAIALWERCAIVTPAPSITHGPKGTIDIYWRAPAFTLLINVPSKTSDPIDYFGCKPDGTEIKGKLDPTLPNHWLLMWMIE